MAERMLTPEEIEQIVGWDAKKWVPDAFARDGWTFFKTMDLARSDHRTIVCRVAREHGEAVVRKAACERLDAAVDECAAVLVQVALTDPTQLVRCAAIRRLDSTRAEHADALAKLALDDPNVAIRVYAQEYLSASIPLHARVLMRTVEECDDDQIREDAMGRLDPTDEEQAQVIERVARRDPHVRMRVLATQMLDPIMSAATLATVALEDRSEKVRSAARDNLSKRAVASSKVPRGRHDSSGGWGARERQVREMNRETQRAAIVAMVMTDPQPEVRRSALLRLDPDKDAAVIAGVAVSDPDGWVRTAAQYGLTAPVNRPLLEWICRYDTWTAPFWGMKTPQDVLTALKAKEQEPEVGVMAPGM